MVFKDDRRRQMQNRENTDKVNATERAKKTIVLESPDLLEMAFDIYLYGLKTATFLPSTHSSLQTIDSLLEKPEAQKEKGPSTEDLFDDLGEFKPIRIIKSQPLPDFDSFKKSDDSTAKEDEEVEKEETPRAKLEDVEPEGIPEREERRTRKPNVPSKPFSSLTESGVDIDKIRQEEKSAEHEESAEEAPGTDQPGSDKEAVDQPQQVQVAKQEKPEIEEEKAEPVQPVLPPRKISRSFLESIEEMPGGDKQAPGAEFDIPKMGAPKKLREFSRFRRTFKAPKTPDMKRAKRIFIDSEDDIEKGEPKEESESKFKPWEGLKKIAPPRFKTNRQEVTKPSFGIKRSKDTPSLKEKLFGGQDEHEEEKPQKDILKTIDDTKGASFKAGFLGQSPIKPQKINVKGLSKSKNNLLFPNPNLPATSLSELMEESKKDKKKPLYSPDPTNDLSEGQNPDTKTREAVREKAVKPRISQPLEELDVSPVEDIPELDFESNAEMVPEDPGAQADLPVGMNTPPLDDKGGEELYVAADEAESSTERKETIPPDDKEAPEQKTESVYLEKEVPPFLNEPEPSEEPEAVAEPEKTGIDTSPADEEEFEPVTEESFEFFTDVPMEEVAADSVEKAVVDAEKPGVEKEKTEPDSVPNVKESLDNILMKKEKTSEKPAVVKEESESEEFGVFDLYDFDEEITYDFQEDRQFSQTTSDIPPKKDDAAVSKAAEEPERAENPSAFTFEMETYQPQEKSSGFLDKFKSAFFKKPKTLEAQEDSGETVEAAPLRERPRKRPPRKAEQPQRKRSIIDTFKDAFFHKAMQVEESKETFDSSETPKVASQKEPAEEQKKVQPATDAETEDDIYVSEEDLKQMKEAGLNIHLQPKASQGKKKEVSIWARMVSDDYDTPEKISFQDLISQKSAQEEDDVQITPEELEEIRSSGILPKERISAPPAEEETDETIKPAEEESKDDFTPELMPRAQIFTQRGKEIKQKTGEKTNNYEEIPVPIAKKKEIPDIAQAESESQDLEDDKSIEDVARPFSFASFKASIEKTATPEDEMKEKAEEEDEKSIWARLADEEGEGKAEKISFTDLMGKISKQKKERRIPLVKPEDFEPSVEEPEPSAADEMESGAEKDEQAKKLEFGKFKKSVASEDTEEPSKTSKSSSDVLEQMTSADFLDRPDEEIYEKLAESIITSTRKSENEKAKEEKAARAVNDSKEKKPKIPEKEEPSESLSTEPTVPKEEKIPPGVKEAEKPSKKKLYSISIDDWMDIMEGRAPEKQEKMPEKMREERPMERPKGKAEGKTVSAPVKEGPQGEALLKTEIDYHQKHAIPERVQPKKPKEKKEPARDGLKKRKEFTKQKLSFRKRFKRKMKHPARLCSTHGTKERANLCVSCGEKGASIMAQLCPTCASDKKHAFDCIKCGKPNSRAIAKLCHLCSPGYSRVCIKCGGPINK